MKVKLNVNLVDVFTLIDNIINNEARVISTYVIKGTVINGNSIFESQGKCLIKSEKDFLSLDDNEKHSGIYVFKVINEVEVNSAEGEFNDVVKPASLLKKSAIEKEVFSKDEILYVGKKEDDICTRVNEHINMSEDGTTSSLRLNAKSRRHLFGNIEVYIFTLKKEYDSHKKIILTGVEHYLHELLKPLVGSKRS